jgi:hypothetical protein
MCEAPWQASSGSALPLNSGSRHIAAWKEATDSWQVINVAPLQP